MYGEAWAGGTLGASGSVSLLVLHASAPLAPAFDEALLGSDSEAEPEHAHASHAVAIEKRRMLVP
jgi:hypothetical protein